jgi:hypothetical protein
MCGEALWRGSERNVGEEELSLCRYSEGGTGKHPSTEFEDCSIY